MITRRGPPQYPEPHGAAPVRAEARAPERVIEAGRVVHHDRALRPQVDHIGFHTRVGVVELADLLRHGAVQRAGYGQLASAGEDFRIVEALATSDKAPLVFAGIAGLRTRLAVQRTRQQIEAGLLRTRLGLDDLAAPAYAGATRATLLGAGGGDVGISTFQRFGNRCAAGQQGEGCGEDEGAVQGHGISPSWATACAVASALI